MAKVINRLLAEDLASRVNPIPKQCYKNSLLAMHALDGTPAQVTYVEGHVHWNGLYIEHGWLVVDGLLVDVTLYHYDDCAAEDYYPVFEYTFEQVQDEIITGRLGPYLDIPFWEKTRDRRQKMHEAGWRHYEQHR